MSFLLKRQVQIYEIPEALKRWIQDKGRSSYHHLTFMPIAFPVFVMNPAEYAADQKAEFPFKEILNFSKAETSTFSIETSTVPAEEIWEVTNMYLNTSAAATLLFNQRTSTDLYYIAKKLNATFLVWSGRTYVGAGKYLSATASVKGDLFFTVLGVKRYA